MKKLQQTKELILKKLTAEWVNMITQKSPHLKTKQIQWMAEVAAEAQFDEVYLQ
mgnify:CR=1 FL=1|jgi:hypothetical protein